MEPWYAPVRRLSLFAVLFVLAVFVAREVLSTTENLAMFWPAAGVAALYALVARSRVEVALVAVGAFAIIVPWYLGAGFTTSAAVLVGLANAANPVVTRSVYRLLGGAADPAFRRTVGVYRFMLAGLAGAAVATVFGILMLRAQSGHVDPSMATAWFFRYIAGTFLVTGTGLAILGWNRKNRLTPVHEILVLLGATILTSAGVLFASPQLSLGFALLLLLFWSATRFPVALAAAHAAFLSVLMIAMVTLEPEVITVGQSPLARSTAVQIFITVSCALAILISASMNDRIGLIRNLRTANQNATRLFSDAPQGVAELSRDGVILRANDSLADVLGMPVAQLPGTRLDDIAPGHEASVAEFLDSVRQGHEDLDTVEWRLGEDRLINVSGRLLSGSTTDDDRILVHLTDLSERRRFEVRLEHLANHDALTGLANRRYFDLQLALAAERFARDGTHGALLVMDLDHFKEVNDVLGHSAGDTLLKEVAQLLTATVRSTDVVGRLGGDEFAILLTETDQLGAEVVAGKIVSTIAENFAGSVTGRRSVTASLGGATFAGAQAFGTDPMALADMMLYDAKDLGRNTAAVFDPATGLRPRTGARMEMKMRLEDAICNDRLVLHLQPILDTRSGQVRGAEALVRMVDPDAPDRLIMPAEFVGIAETTGLGTRLDQWVIRNGVALLPQLKPDSYLTLNVSGASLGDAAVFAALTESIAAHDVDPRRVVIEVTETAAILDVEAARAFAAGIHDIGARFALDDFGAGYGSFHYLKALDFDLVKIDGEFIANLDTSATDRAIVRAIVQVAQELGKEIVAEFVGSHQVLADVTKRGIEYAQGYAIGRPVPPTEFAQTWGETR